MWPALVNVVDIQKVWRVVVQVKAHRPRKRVINQRPTLLPKPLQRFVTRQPKSLPSNGLQHKLKQKRTAQAKHNNERQHNIHIVNPNVVASTARLVFVLQLQKLISISAIEVLVRPEQHCKQNTRHCNATPVNSRDPLVRTHPRPRSRFPPLLNLLFHLHLRRFLLAFRALKPRF